MYEWLKVLHVISVISWMAGLLYLPRLFVYHCAVAAGSEASETFKIMERRLLKAIMTPAMIASWLFGLWLAWLAGFWTSGWFLAKLALVLALSGVHGYLAKQVKLFAADANTQPARHFRIVNEAPTLMMIGIVIFVIVKPF